METASLANIPNEIGHIVVVDIAFLLAAWQIIRHRMKSAEEAIAELERKMDEHSEKDAQVLSELKVVSTNLDGINGRLDRNDRHLDRRFGELERRTSN